MVRRSCHNGAKRSSTARHLRGQLQKNTFAIPDGMGTNQQNDLGSQRYGFATRGKQPPLPEGHVEIQLRVVDGSGNRVSVPISLLNNEGNVVVSGKTKDERFDANDHLSVALPENQKVQTADFTWQWDDRQRHRCEETK